MTEASPAQTHGEGQPEEPIPFWQRFLDDLVLLIVLGLVVPIVSFWVWGLVEVATVPRLP